MTVTPTVATLASVSGSAVLAFWLCVVHRRLGPQTLRASLLAAAAALPLLEIVKLAAPGVAETTNTAVTLLGFVVPVFGFAFWSGAVVIRAFATGPFRN